MTQTKNLPLESVRLGGRDYRGFRIVIAIGFAPTGGMKIQAAALSRQIGIGMSLASTSEAIPTKSPMRDVRHLAAVQMKALRKTICNQ